MTGWQADSQEEGMDWTYWTQKDTESGISLREDTIDLPYPAEKLGQEPAFTRKNMSINTKKVLAVSTIPFLYWVDSRKPFIEKDRRIFLESFILGE